MCTTGELSCKAKLVRVVLENQGPLSPREAAEEARIDRTDAKVALEELVEVGFAKKVCGLCASREEVYELTEAGREQDHAKV